MWSSSCANLANQVQQLKTEAFIFIRLNLKTLIAFIVYFNWLQKNTTTLLELNHKLNMRTI